METLLYFFDGFNEVKSEDPFDGPNDGFPVDSQVKTLLCFFNGSNEDNPDNSFDGSNDGFTVRL